MQGKQINEMKINGKEIEQNVSLDDGRVGYKYPHSSRSISKACDKFFEKRGLDKYGNKLDPNELSKLRKRNNS